MRSVRRLLLAVVAGAFAFLCWLPAGSAVTSPQTSRVPAAVATTSYPWVYPRAGLGVRAVEPGVLHAPEHSIQPPSWIAIG